MHFSSQRAPLDQVHTSHRPNSWLIPVTGFSRSPTVAFATPALTSNVSPSPPTVSSITATAYSSFTAGIADANNQSPPPAPPLRFPAKRRNSVVEFSQSFRTNFIDNLQRVFRTLRHLYHTLTNSQRLNEFRDTHLISCLHDHLTFRHKVAYDGFSAAKDKLQRISQTWTTVSKDWAIAQLTTSAQLVQNRIDNLRGWACDRMWSSTEIQPWRSNEEEETWWQRWNPARKFVPKSTSTPGFLQSFQSLFTWAYRFIWLALYLLPAFVGCVLALVLLCFVLGALVILRRVYGYVRALWDALLHGA